MTVSALLLLTASLAQIVPAPPGAAPQGTVPGVLITPSKEVVLLITNSGECQARAIETGKVLWKQDKVGILLGFKGEVVYLIATVDAKTEAVKIGAVEATTGKRKFESKEFAFRAIPTSSPFPVVGPEAPAWSVWPCENPDRHYFFRPQSFMKGDQLIVEWSVQGGLHRGIPTPPISASGTTRIDMKTGEASGVKRGEKRPEGFVALPHGFSNKTKVGGVTLSIAVKSTKSDRLTTSQGYLQAHKADKLLWESPQGNPRIVGPPRP